MTERLTIAVEDGTRALLVELAGGERRIGQLVSRLARDLHAGRLLTAEQVQAERKQAETYIDAAVQEYVSSDEDMARLRQETERLQESNRKSEALRLQFHEALADVQALRKQLEEDLARVEKVGTRYDRLQDRVQALEGEEQGSASA